MRLYGVYQTCYDKNWNDSNINIYWSNYTDTNEYNKTELELYGMEH